MSRFAPGESRKHRIVKDFSSARMIGYPEITPLHSVAHSSFQSKWSAPAGKVPGRGCRVKRNSAKGPVSRILSCAVIPLGAALPRTLISDLPGGFGDCIEQPQRAPRHVKSRLNASGRCVAPPDSERALPSLFGLAPCGVYPAPPFTGRAVRSYRTISPLPRREPGRTGEPFRSLRMPFRVRMDAEGVAEAVSFLWHWPSMGFEAHVPDVIRHTALRSSDFPPPANLACAKKPAATARSSCQ
jgi:hypothetical protein